jgi:hypothetical protein
MWRFRQNYGQNYVRAIGTVSEASLLLTAMVTLILIAPSQMRAQDKPAAVSGGAQVAKAIGTIKAIQANSITVAAESGGDVTARLSSTTKILRVPPGEKDLKNATALQSQDLQPGDRVLVRGQATADGRTIAALAVIVMKQTDVAAKQQHDREDWQKRGVAGLVTQVDAAAGTVTISSGGASGDRSVAVHVAKNTILRRYAPGSVKFDDAKPGPLDQIKAGDQLRARGTRSPDGNELGAEEIVSGSFRNIAGIIKEIDASSNTMTVQDGIGKNAVVVKISPDSQMKKLPAEMAQHIATRFKSAATGASGDQPGNGQAVSGQGGSPSGGPGGNGSPDLQRMLSRLPNGTLADLQKGDAVMIVSTVDGNPDAVTAITLLAGVDAILTAAPNRAASTLLSPWSLNASAGEGEAAQ